MLGWLKDPANQKLLVIGVLTVIVLACIWYLPLESAWTLLGQITAGLLRLLLPA